jgi:hypothetical protein
MVKCHEFVGDRPCQGRIRWHRHAAFGLVPYCNRHKNEWQARNPNATGTLWSETMTEIPSDPYTHWRRRAETAEAEVARLNMEMEAYRQKLTPKDVEAMTAVIKALTEEKARRSQSDAQKGLKDGT